MKSSFILFRTIKKKWGRYSSYLRLSAVFLLFTFIQLESVAIYSQTTRFSFDLKQISIENVLNDVESKSQYRFLYNKNQVDVSRKIDVQITNATINQLMQFLFNNSDIAYLIKGNQIVLNKQEKPTPRSVKGVVLDAEGNPIIGATVIDASTSQGTITDYNGNFTLTVSTESKLLVSYIGFTSTEVLVGNKQEIVVRLKEDVKLLDEVVVIGYGTIRKGDLTGAVSTLSNENITNRKTTQLSTALQGSMSGVMVTRSNSAPGSTGSIKVRGITTISNSDPLVIIDGVPGSIDDINPNDVENISVLKDAASAAIYGARAASGVLVVTTKRAKSDDLSIEYTFEQGFDMITREPGSVGVTRFMEMANELTWNDAGNGTNRYPLFSNYVIENYNELHLENPDVYPNTNWNSLIMKNSAPKQSHVFSISGGTKAVRTKVGLVYDKVDGLYMNRDYERLTLRVNNDFVVSKFVSAALDVYYKQTNSTNPVSEPLERSRISPPVYAAVWQDGRVAEGKAGDNVYAALKYGGITTNRFNQIGGKLALHVTPIEDLKFSAIVSPSLNASKVKRFSKKVNYASASDPTNFIGTISGHASTDLMERRNDDNSITIQFLGNYNKKTSFGNINAMVGYESYYHFYENLYASRDQYELTGFPYLDIGPLELRDNGGNAYEIAYQSVFGRIIYSYKSKYLLQANLRYDASSRFAPEYRWGSFPSFSAGWVLTEEDFMKNNSTLSFLKIRGSWGSLGNERIGTYPYQSTIVFNPGIFYQGTTRVSQLTAAQQQFAIRDITWETTETLDVGIDMGFFNNKLRASFDYYSKTTRDMLLPIEIPDYIGYENPDQNTGKMYTKGFDFEVSWHDKIGKWRYGASLNLSDFRSIMGDLGGTEFIGDQIKIEGSEFNEWYGYKSEGLYQNAEEVAQSARLNDNVKPGDIKYVDISGPDGVPDGKISPEYDRVLLGGSLPRFMYGGVFSGGYNGLDLSVTVQGIGKQLVRTDKMFNPYPQSWGNFPENLEGKYWSMLNSEEENLNASYPRLTRTGLNNNQILSDFWLINGAYLRLKNIAISYTYSIPEAVSKKIGINRVRAYVSGSDLFSIDQYPAGWDPELGGLSSYPITRSFVMGISVNL